ncbi:DNA-binding transcriptional regulator, MerR family [Cupriavidus necator]|uniref:MerR family transcriptional regulator n=1 Tax=Cupriavidus necator (strain ATCC 17699 / DSM 428 / KCTC 22496 / NCIMB 10442 / H16 / Stanier 337) TaxID=381666 RepID=Q0KFI0_CUPNH|nr:MULTISPECIES: MerR family transcriptional regulator [Cupriavidus]EON19450.1 MerR family transcriptional regulator [Cupriavidus sp. GA3-3]KUE88286.1 MerR family transcriptional regulator [Cupriavidus necator]QCB99203.1 MerR family transcriptional regulator [Cupriavidus necator H16]QQB77979.1 MerR family transcriptional regulator [Cupriavidus necator]WKA41030.1 MerR family transcriptional regulator [Cupriavidus necator]
MTLIRRRHPSSPTSQASDTTPPAPEYTIDELARVAGTTVRNVRSYQDRGLIDPPQRRGRVGIYTQAHLGRLKLIHHLLARGYTLANITELLKAIVEGHDLRSILGLETAISSPWTNETPRHYSYLALARLFGRAISRPALAKAISLGLLEPDGLGYLARSPRALAAGAEIAQAGFALEDVLEIIAQSRGHFQAVSDHIVATVVRELDRFGIGKLPPPQDVPRLVEILWRIRPLALVMAETEMMRALEISANKYLGDRVAAIIEHLHDEEDGSGGKP